MSDKLSEKLVASLEFRGRETVIWDADFPGFGVRLWRGGKAYIVQLKVLGKSRRKTLGACGSLKLADARDIAQKLKGAVAAGRDPFAEEQTAREAWTLHDALEYFLGDYTERRHLSERYSRDSGMLFRHAVPRSWHGRKLTTFTQDQIARLHREHAVTPRRANALLQLLSRLFTLGVERGYCTGNPVKGVQKYSENKRDRFLSDNELASVWEYLNKAKNREAAVAVQLVLLTGCRPGEAFKAKWSDIDLATGVWTKPASTTKQRKVHRVSLSKTAVAVLSGLKTLDRSPYLFPHHDDVGLPRLSVNRFWDQLRKALSIGDVRLYDVRHTHASHLIAEGASPFEVRDALGHASITTTNRYVHVADDRHREVAEMFAAKLPGVAVPEAEELIGAHRPRQLKRLKNGLVREEATIQVSDSLMRMLKGAAE